MTPIKDVVATIGQTYGREPRRPFGIKTNDRLHHIAVFGQTGTGKSTLLSQLMRQDFLNGQGFGLIDPHGDLAKAICADASEEVIYWDVANPNCPYGYNPLTFTKPEYRPLIASGLIEALKKQWAGAWGARMEHLLRYALLALLERPQSNLQDIIPLFLDKSFRGQVLANVTDPHLKWFWETEYRAINFKNAADGVAPIANKLGAFLANPVVRKAVCQPEQPLRFRHIMDNSQALIVNLAKGKLGTDVANVLGGLVASSLASAALSRTTIPETQRRPWFLYLDEWQSFTTSAMADMLAELRKYKLGLALATQHSSRLDEDVREAVFGNAGTLISFRVGAEDAPLLTRQFGADIPTVRDLVNQPNYQMYIKLFIDGVQSRPFSARTLRYS
jgi:type IV secretory pathway TraG/TraD family ATPase VirD4